MATAVFFFLTAFLAVGFAYPDGTTADRVGSPAVETVNSVPAEVNLLKHWEGKVVVVTGASSGIGAALSRSLVNSGLTVVGLGRTKAKLEVLERSLAGAKGKFYSVEADVSKEDDVKRAFEWIKSNLTNVDALVNNAGGTVLGTILDLEPSAYKNIFDTNVLGLLYCTREAFKIMKEKKTAGTIININSVLGHRTHDIPGIDLNVYAATKFAVTALTETLQIEMKNANLNIRVTSISPGAVKTNFTRPEGFDEGAGKGQPVLQPEAIANAIVYVLSVPQDVHITELTIKPLGQVI